MKRAPRNQRAGAHGTPPRAARRVKVEAESVDPPAPAPTQADPLGPAHAWFASRGWTPFAFQSQVWSAYLAGRSGLVHAPTGMGKTLAVALGPMLEALAIGPTPRGLRLLWLTPLRALAADTAGALQAAVEGLDLSWRVELRTGDTPQARKAKQRAAMPEVLVTTPESLSVLLSYADIAGPPSMDPDAPNSSPLAGLRCVVVDEWHELLGTKRGVQTELALARLRSLSPRPLALQPFTPHPRATHPRATQAPVHALPIPGLRVWGLSATMGNTSQAMDVLVGPAHASQRRSTATAATEATAANLAHAPLLVRGEGRKAYEFSTLIPRDIERFPWAGHLGLRLLPQVIQQIARARSTLIFTNTRGQAEIWFQALLQADDALMGSVALHHGSLARQLRAKVEHALATGQLRACVCTSSLDLGVDFAPVDQVIQIGSPKGVARFLQRAGRSGHQPGAVSRVVCVPTNALELVEFAAARSAISVVGDVQVEARTPLCLALDVLVQHMLTLAVGGGFNAQQLVAEVRQTNAFATLTDQQWGWCLDYVQRGGPALAGYARYQRAVLDEPTGLYRVAPGALARAHRMSIGTIVGDQGMLVKFTTGRVLGNVEEGFIARMKPGDVFAFSGRVLELVRVRGMDAIVRPAKRAKGNVPSWQGARMPLSSQLAGAVRELMGQAQLGHFDGPEMRAAEPVLRLQAQWSRLPAPNVLLIEHNLLPDGHHAFVYPLAGRLVHEGLAALCAHRLSAQHPRSFTLAAADHGFHLHCATPFELDAAAWRTVLSRAYLADDVLAAMNAAGLARRQFREVARVAGLVTQGFPGERVGTRQLQASAEMFYDVLTQFDEGNLLLDQSRREVLEKQLELSRMESALREIESVEIIVMRPDRLTPLAFPLWVDSLREQVSTERWTVRMQRMLGELEREAGPVLQSRPARSAFVQVAQVQPAIAVEIASPRPRRRPKINAKP